jgi:hemoglobin/transferrin/lactoferrin receptor protein
VETILEYRFNDHWRLETALAWTEGTDSDTEEPLRRIPPLNGNARLRYAHDPNLWTEVAVVWADHQKRLAPGDISDPRIGPDGTPGYVVFDLRAGYKLARQHEIIVGVENLADKKYKTHGSGGIAQQSSIT